MTALARPFRGRVSLTPALSQRERGLLGGPCEPVSGRGGFRMIWAVLVRGWRWRVLCAVCLAACMAAFSFGVASAQEESDDSLIDLTVYFGGYSLLGSKLEYFLEAKNRGNADAVGVRVEVFLQNQKISPGNFGGPGAAGTSYSSIKSKGNGDTEGTWEIGTLRAGETKTLVMSVGLDNKRDSNADSMFGRSTATISSDTGEAAALLHDNEATAFGIYRKDGKTNVSHGVMLDNSAAVMVSVDDQNPRPGASVNFTLVVVNLNAYIPSQLKDNSIVDVEVPIRLAPGLEFASGWTPAPSQGTFMKANSRSGTWDVGDIVAARSEAKTMQVEAELTTDSLASIPLEERCFSAWVSDMTPPPDPGFVLGSLTECLGDDPPVLLEEGTLGVMTAFPCVGVLTYPCVDKDRNGVSDAGVVVAAAAEADNLTVRGHGVGRVDVGATSTNQQVILRPENGVIIQVKDPQGRIFDTQSNSLTSGTTPSWQTAREPNSQSGNYEVGGVTITWTRKNFNDQIADWSSYVRGVSVAGLNGSAAPGRVRVRPPRTGSIFLDPNPTAERNPLNLTSPSTTVAALFVEFDKLGTYVFNYNAKLARTDTTEDPNSYTGTGRYIFHVGPIAELSVRDGGPNLSVPAGQRAFSVLAVNNGPDDAPDAEVTIKGLSAGDVQSHSATKGSFDATSGVWTIGELRAKEKAQNLSGRDGEVLTIIPNRSADKEITATVRNTQDYSVVISETTHTTKYYDYIEGNDSATIGLHEGTGDLLPTLQVTGLGGAAMLARWSDLPSLFNRKVAHYEIERSTDGGKSWTMLDDQVVKTAYVDLDATPANNPTYRVRAVNGLFHKGPWSSLLGPTGSKSPRGTAEAPGGPVNVGAAADGGSAIDVRWDAPTEDGGAPITRYEVQWSANGESGWRRAGYVNDTQSRTYKHSGLSFGDTRYYRVRAQNSGGWGSWSDPPASATTRAGVPDAPTLTTHSTTADTIRLRWSDPRDNGGAITQYEIQWSQDGSVDSWQSLTNIAAEDVQVQDENYNEYSDTSVPSGDERYYRARAVNSMGAGRWSGVVSAVTPPGIPTPFRAEPNGPNAILLTWGPPDDATDGSTVTGYELEVSTDSMNGPWTRLRSLGATERTFNHTGLRPDDTRHYQMRACNGAGCGHWSSPSSATVLPGVPYAPGLTARANSASEIKLSWTKPNDGGSEITSYELEHYTDGSDWTSLDGNISSDVREYFHQKEFGGGTTHRYRVRAVNAEGGGAWSAARSVTISAQAPGKTDLSFGDTTDNSITLTWTVPEDNGSRISGYRVERNDRVGGYDNWVHIGTAGASATSYTDRNLYSGSYYCYRVAANSSAGAGPYSDETCESTTGYGPRDPDPPIARLSSVSPTRVTVTWDPPLSDGGRPVLLYLYEQEDEDGNFDGNCQYHHNDRELWADSCKMVSAGTRSATFSNLEAGQSHKFRLRAETVEYYSDWRTMTVHLPDARDDAETPSVTEDLQLRVSPASLTVNEGRGQASYRLTLSKAPQEGESIRLDWYMDTISPNILMDYDAVGNCYDFGDFTRENWNSGCTITLFAEEDADSDNEIAIMEHSITVGGREVSGPGVRVEVRDND